jgi:hypothetical protein
MDVVCEHGLSVHAHAATTTCVKHGSGNLHHVCSADGLLPFPRVPRDVCVQPARLMRPTLAHCMCSACGLTPGRRPGVHARTTTEPGAVGQGHAPGRQRTCRAPSRRPSNRGHAPDTPTPARTPSPGSVARHRAARAR